MFADKKSPYALRHPLYKRGTFARNLTLMGLRTRKHTGRFVEETVSVYKSSEALHFEYRKPTDWKSSDEYKCVCENGILKMQAVMSPGGSAYKDIKVSMRLGHVTARENYDVQITDYTVDVYISGRLRKKIEKEAVWRGEITGAITYGSVSTPTMAFRERDLTRMRTRKVTLTCSYDKKRKKTIMRASGGGKRVYYQMKKNLQLRNRVSA